MFATQRSNAVRCAYGVRRIVSLEQTCQRHFSSYYAVTAAAPNSSFLRRNHQSLHSTTRSCPSLQMIHSQRSFATDAASSPKEHSSAPVEEEEVYTLPRSFLVNTAYVPGYQVVKTIGLVAGNTVRVRNFINDYVAMIRSVFGGELRTYTNLMMEAREEATERMVEEAVELGANAIINIRMTTSKLATNASEIYVYGTAVVVQLPASTTISHDTSDTSSSTTPTDVSSNTETNAREIDPMYARVL